MPGEPCPKCEDLIKRRICGMCAECWNKAQERTRAMDNRNTLDLEQAFREGYEAGHEHGHYGDYKPVSAMLEWGRERATRPAPEAPPAQAPAPGPEAPETADPLREAVEAMKQAGPSALAMFRNNGIVFKGKGGPWEKIAFTLYTELAQLSQIAETALEAAPASATRFGEPSPNLTPKKETP